MKINSLTLHLLATATVLCISGNAQIIGPMEASDLTVENWVPPASESDEGFFPLDTIVGKTITF
jgi:hypothetical protein